MHLTHDLKISIINTRTALDIYSYRYRSIKTIAKLSRRILSYVVKGQYFMTRKLSNYVFLDRKVRLFSLFVVMIEGCIPDFAHMVGTALLRGTD